MAGDLGQSETSGPGRFEYGTLSFPARGKYGKRRDVELDDDGSVTISWIEKADDFYGTVDRRCYFTAEEVEQIIATRRSVLDA